MGVCRGDVVACHQMTRAFMLLQQWQWLHIHEHRCLLWHSPAADRPCIATLDLAVHLRGLCDRVRVGSWTRSNSAVCAQPPCTLLHGFVSMAPCTHRGDRSCRELMISLNSVRDP